MWKMLRGQSLSLAPRECRSERRRRPRSGKRRDGAHHGTADTRIFNPLLYQLSYPVFLFAHRGRFAFGSDLLRLEVPSAENFDEGCFAILTQPVR